MSIPEMFPWRPPIVWVGILSATSLLLSALLALVFLVRLPANAFAEDRPGWPKTMPGLLLRVVTNVLGWLLVVLGLVLSVPGVPGQGILTILVGLLLVEFPGRNRLIRRLLHRPPLQRRLDRIRVRFGRPPFTW